MSRDERTNLAIDVIERAREAPDRVGLHFEDGRRWTYAEMVAAARRVAAGLRAQPIEPGERVALFLPNGPELVFGLLGCWIAGAVPVAVSPLYGPDELASSVAKVEPALTVVAADDAAARRLLDDGRRVALLTTATEPAAGSLPLLDADPADLPDGAHPVAPDDEGVVLFTGGTTGSAKAVSLTHGGMRKSIQDLALAMKGGKPGPYPLAPERVGPNLLLLPLFHSGGQSSFLFAYFVGRAVVLTSRFRVETVARLTVEHGIDNLFLMPTMVYDLAHAPDDVELPTVRSVLISGQALDPIVKRDFEQRYGIPILTNYGATELGHVAGWMARDLKEGRWKPGAAGRIYDTAEVEIRAEDGTVLGPGEVGEICVRTSVSRGYVDSGEDGVSMLVDADGWVHSGDMGYIDEDRVLFLTGRKRDMIKTGGFQIWPAELETTLREHPAVRDVAVVGRPDARLGEIPVALVVPADGVPTDDATAQELIAFVRDRLAHFKAIRAVEFLDALPRTEAGKVDRGALQRMAGGAAA